MFDYDKIKCDKIRITARTNPEIMINYETLLFSFRFCSQKLTLGGGNGNPGRDTIESSMKGF